MHRSMEGDGRASNARPGDDDPTVILDPVTDPSAAGVPAQRDAATPLGRAETGFGSALKWSYLLMTGGNLVVSALTFVVTALLSPLEFGLVTLGMVWVALALVLLQHGPTIAIIQQDGITDEHVNAAFWATVTGSLGYSLLLAVAAPLWAAANGLPELIPICLALAPVVLLQGINVVPDAMVRRRMQMKGLAFRVLVANLSGGLTAIGCAIAGFGVWALVAQQLVWPTVYAILLWNFIDWRPKFRGPIFAPLRDMRRTSLQTYGGAFGSYLASRVDVVLMGLYFGPVVIGLYRFASRLAEMVNELTSGGLRLVSLPHLSAHGQDNAGLQRELNRLMHGTAVLAFPALGLVAGVSQALVLVIGDQWALAAGPLRVLCLTFAFSTTITIFGVALQAKQRAGIPAIFTWITMALAAGAVIVSARIGSGAGASTQLLAVALAMLLVQTLIMLSLGYVVFRNLRVSPVPTIVCALPGIVAGLAAAATGAATYSLVNPDLNRVLDFFVSSAAGGIVGAAVLYTLDRQTRGMVIRLVRRLAARRRRTVETVEA